jgi:hypothetical protein
MRVSRINIKNVMGVTELEIQPGVVTLISGRNGASKTSIIEAVRSALGKGHDATLLRAGEERGDVVLVLDDGAVIREKITAKATERKVEHPTFGKISKPADYLSKLITGEAANPVALLTTKGPELTKLFLEAIPLHVTSQQIAAITGQPGHVESYRFPCETQHALVVLAGVEKNHFDKRTDVNRGLKEKQGAIEQLTGTLPPMPEGGGDWAATVEDLQQQREALAAQRATALATVTADTELAEQRRTNEQQQEAQRIKADITARKTAIETECNAAIERIKADAALKLESLKTELAQRLAESADAQQAIAAKDTAELTERRENVEAQYLPQLVELDQRLAEASANLEQQNRAQGQRDLVAQYAADAATLDAQRTKLTEVIEGIRALTVSLTANLPIKGVEIVDGEVRVDGVPWNRVNTAKRIQLAVEVAKLHAGTLGLLLVDGLENLDPPTFTAFCKEIEASGCQLIGARVTEGPLRVESHQAPVGDDAGVTF